MPPRDPGSPPRPATAPAGADERLQAYRGKRTADGTHEPFGGGVASAGRFAAGAAGAGLFVVQKHAARRLHWDFRLEMGGVLVSWAVPHAPSADPADKRLAVQVEDHPVEYADFEGVIPEGNYGAGPVIVWDKGRWVALEDPIAGMDKGKLLFDLHGYKLRGTWTLVRTKRSPKDWLLIKKPGLGAGPEAARLLTPESVLSGLTIEELAQGTSRAAEVRAELEAARSPRRRVRAADCQPMLAETAPAPFSDPAWIFELKYDGYRVIAEREPGGSTRLCLRKGTDTTATFPEIARAIAALPWAGIVVDGEVVVLDDQGRPSFGLLQERASLRNPIDIRAASVRLPASYWVFDLLGFEDLDVRPLPLARRKAALSRLLPSKGPVRLADHVVGEGAAFYAEVQRMDLEGIMAKRADRPYVPGRSPYWLKLRVEHTGDFVVVGWSQPKGTRTGLGALHLAGYLEGELWYVGKVGSGFDERLLRRLVSDLTPHERKDPPFLGQSPREKGNHWVTPRLAVEVRYGQVSKEAVLRFPVFVRLRDDKPLADCPLPREAAVLRRPALAAAGSASDPPPSPAPGPAPADPGSAERRVTLTNAGKVFWPEERYTKGDLVGFYRDVAPWLLLYLRDRPLVLTRFPDGITGKSFFQKDAPDFVPGWIRTERMWSEESRRAIDYFVADDAETLLYLVNLGTIPLHVWSSRVATLERPDWSIVDLDPKGAPFADVVRIARFVHDLCADIALPSFIKTSGQQGLHVLVPLAGRLTYHESRALAELIARLVVEELGDIATVARPLGSRQGKVYVDFGQNGHGQLLVAPFSVRPVQGATVSTPLTWDEVGAGLDPRAFTIRTVPERLARGGDPLAPILDTVPDLGAALARLAERLGGKKGEERARAGGDAAAGKLAAPARAPGARRGGRRR